MLAYFMQRSKLLKPSTMWSEYSKLRTTIYLNRKRQSEGYRGKKSKVFTKDEVHAFLKEANDETYLMLKVLLIVGISGACRRQELLQLSIKDIEDMGEFLKIQILETKTKVPREFTITPGNTWKMHCLAHPVGINTIGGAPKQIATSLGLKNPKEYTGHAFRRSSATLLAESGADTSILKRLGGWKSTNVAEGYVGASIQNKKKIAQMILGKDNTTTKLKTFNNEEEVEEMFKEIIDQISNEKTKLQEIVQLLIYVDSTKEVPLVVFIKFQVLATSEDGEYLPAGFQCCLFEDNEETHFYHKFTNENLFREFWEILETKVNEKLKEKKTKFVPILIVDFEKYSHCFLIRGLKHRDEVTIKGSVKTKVVSLIKTTIHTELKCLDFYKFLPRDSDYDSNRHEDIKKNVMDMVGIFEKIKKLCNRSELDLTNYSSLAQFAWDYMLEFRSKNAEEPIPILEDEDKIAFIAESMRGGLCDSPKRKAEANNRHVKNYNEHDQQTFIVSLDLNNAYGWAMSQNLPWDNFRWVDEKQFGDHYHVIHLKENDETGYIFEVDLEYPKELHDEHNDLPFCCVHSTARNEPRLELNLDEKKNYVILDQNLKQCLKYGLQLKKIHGVLQFTKKPWLKDYVYYNTRLRNNAQDLLERNFYKMLNIKVYGKLNERFDKHRDTKVITTAEDLRKYNPINVVRINEDVGLVEFNQEKTNSERPKFTAFAVLELSKMRMYEFHYDVMIKKYRDSLKLLRLSVDNLIYEIETKDFDKDLKSHPKLLIEFVPDGDLSKKTPEEVLGKMKDDSDGKIISKFYSTQYSNHFIRFVDGSCKKAVPQLTEQEKEKLTEEDFHKCIFDDNPIEVETVKTFTKECKVFKQKIRKVVVRPSDPKRYIKADKVNTLAKGHKDIPATSN
ncbi:hypothetical protein GEV33_006736 [Tenebrio molitor]|uniref:Tyr recombinase domain-containing protein n=1 Tax=Tenebrio molitor TaxID=7067 RepID=A0A8J6HC24_TENMO|nr:hypothetical protein GEV33_006736 [Tenebrio molitor]